MNLQYHEKLDQKTPITLTLVDYQLETTLEALTAALETMRSKYGNYDQKSKNTATKTTSS